MHLNASDYERILIWKGATRAWLQHPVFGWGLDNFLGAFRANRGLEYINSPALHGTETNMQADAHNIFLQVLATLGIFGLYSFTRFIWNVWQFLQDRKYQSDYSRAVRASIIALFTVSLIEPVSLSCWVVAAMILGSIV